MGLGVEFEVERAPAAGCFVERREFGAAGAEAVDAAVQALGPARRTPADHGVAIELHALRPPAPVFDARAAAAVVEGERLMVEDRRVDGVTPAVEPHRDGAVIGRGVRGDHHGRDAPLGAEAQGGEQRVQRAGDGPAGAAGAVMQPGCEEIGDAVAGEGAGGVLVEGDDLADVVEGDVAIPRGEEVAQPGKGRLGAGSKPEALEDPVEEGVGEGSLQRRASGSWVGRLSGGGRRGLLISHWHCGGRGCPPTVDALEREHQRLDGTLGANFGGRVTPYLPSANGQRRVVVESPRAA